MNVKYEWWFLTMKISFVGFTTSCFFGMAPILYVCFSYTPKRIFEKSDTVNAITYDAVNRYGWVVFLFIAIFRDLTEVFIFVPSLYHVYKI